MYAFERMQLEFLGFQCGSLGSDQSSHTPHARQEAQKSRTQPGAQAKAWPPFPCETVIVVPRADWLGAKSQKQAWNFHRLVWELRERKARHNELEPLSHKQLQRAPFKPLCDFALERAKALAASAVVRICFCLVFV